MDHVAHPVGGPTSFAVVNGKCPSTHPVKIPQVHLEVSSSKTPDITTIPRELLTLDSQIVWDTSKFNNKADWPADGSQPFVLSNGDT
jgi:Domain of unknown function (DUF1996)